MSVYDDAADLYDEVEAEAENDESENECDDVCDNCMSSGVCVSQTCPKCSATMCGDCAEHCNDAQEGLCSHCFAEEHGEAIALTLSALGVGAPMVMTGDGPIDNPSEIAAWERHQAECRAYDAQWPQHCKHCGGWGVVRLIDSVPYGSTSVTLESDEVCEHCRGSERPTCPRCGCMTLPQDGELCAECHWNVGDAGRPKW